HAHGRHRQHQQTHPQAVTTQKNRQEQHETVPQHAITQPADGLEKQVHRPVIDPQIQAATEPVIPDSHFAFCDHHWIGHGVSPLCYWACGSGSQFSVNSCSRTSTSLRSAQCTSDSCPLLSSTSAVQCSTQSPSLQYS